MTKITTGLRNILLNASLSDYPYSRGEVHEQWRQSALSALEICGERGLFQRLNSSGESVDQVFAELIDGAMADFLVEIAGRARLIGGLLRNVADPGRINQGYKGTCAVTSVESYLAERLPEEYVRIIAGLVRPTGEVRLLNDETLFRDEQRLDWGDREAHRGPVSRLFQVSAMEYAYPELDYRNTWDGYVEPDRESVPPPGERLTRPNGVEPAGLDLDAFDRFLEGVTGSRWDTLSQSAAQIATYLEKLGLPASSAPQLERDGMGIVIRSARAGEPTFVTLAVQGQPAFELFGFEPDGPMHMLHKVRVLEVSLAEKRIVYEDPLDPPSPWLPGVKTRIEDLKGRCSMNLEDFENLMIELSFKPEFWSPEYLDGDH